MYWIRRNYSIYFYLTLLTWMTYNYDILTYVISWRMWYLDVYYRSAVVHFQFVSWVLSPYFAFLLFLVFSELKIVFPKLTVASLISSHSPSFYSAVPASYSTVYRKPFLEEAFHEMLSSSNDEKEDWKFLLLQRWPTDYSSLFLLVWEIHPMVCMWSLSMKQAIIHHKRNL